MEKFGQYFNLKEKILIYEKKKEFKFTMFKIKDISIFALIKNNDIDYQNYFIVENRPNLNEFFDRVFDYYYNCSTPLIQFLNR